jgi:cellulose synthase/poly-beta-1,6-N-acetylglucosamine synthase-like glycosyltransferase
MRLFRLTPRRRALLALILLGGPLAATSGRIAPADPADPPPRPAILGTGPVLRQSVVPATSFFARAPVTRVEGDATSVVIQREVVPAAEDTSLLGPRVWIIRVLLYAFYLIIAMVCVYIVRHYLFTLNRLFRPTRQPYVDIDIADWPPITVLIPAHNEQEVIGDILEAVLDADYPRERLTVVPIDDRSTDRTGEIVEAFQAANPDVVRPFLRTEGKPGKAAALNDAMAIVTTEIALVFDADYLPGRGLLKQLVAPFFDPEVGAVMGRVVPHNITRNLLSRLLDLERSGGYQVDQQARMNMGLVPQYGGTVGGVRSRALRAVGGWRVDSLAEDTDATYRLLLAGWKTVYQNRSECYEQVPEDWDGRLRQIRRWAMGHNEVAVTYLGGLLRSARTSLAEKLDGALLLGVYTMSPILVLGWLIGIVLWYLGVTKPGLIVILLVVSYSALGNFATFFEIAAAAHLDGSHNRIRLLPFVFLGFLVSLFGVSRATLSQLLPHKTRSLRWHKTEHNHNGNHGYRLRNGFNGRHEHPGAAS